MKRYIFGLIFLSVFITTSVYGTEGQDCSISSGDDCGPGYGCDGSNCAECVLGLYSDQTSRGDCKDCSIGQYGELAGKGTEVEGCQDCSIGQYGEAAGKGTEAEGCQDCSKGKYGDQTGLTGLGQCTACPNGQVGIAAGQSTVDAGCGNCPLGEYADMDQDPAICIDCPQGQYGKTEGKDSVDDGCQECPGGRYGEQAGKPTVTDGCTKCSLGRFGNSSGESTFDLGCPGVCPQGKYGDQDGGTDGSACGGKCPGGTFGDQVGQGSEISACTFKCFSGKYDNAEGQTNRSSACPGECVKGKYGTEEGATNDLDGCADCPGGKYGLETMGRNESAVCKLCPEGRYGSEPGNDNEEQACEEDCGAGTYQDQKGATNSSFCKNCPSGRFQTDIFLASKNLSTSEAQACDGACKQGQFGTGPGKKTEGLACDDCPNGRYGDQYALPNEALGCPYSPGLLLSPSGFLSMDEGTGGEGAIGGGEIIRIKGFNTIPQSRVLINAALVGTEELLTDEGNPLLRVTPGFLNISTADGWRNFTDSDGSQFTIISELGDYCHERVDADGPSCHNRCKYNETSFKLELTCTSDDVYYSTDAVTQRVNLSIVELKTRLSPLRPVLFVGDTFTELRIEWNRAANDFEQAMQERHRPCGWNLFEVQISTSEYFPEEITNVTQQKFAYTNATGNSTIGTFYFHKNVSKKLSDEVVYVRVKKIVAGAGYFYYEHNAVRSAVFCIWESPVGRGPQRREEQTNSATAEKE